LAVCVLGPPAMPHIAAATVAARGCARETAGARAEVVTAEGLAVVKAILDKLRRNAGSAP
jgi:hypothetical protein